MKRLPFHIQSRKKHCAVKCFVSFWTVNACVSSPTPLFLFFLPRLTHFTQTQIKSNQSEFWRLMCFKMFIIFLEEEFCFLKLKTFRRKNYLLTGWMNGWIGMYVCVCMFLFWGSFPSTFSTSYKLLSLEFTYTSIAFIYPLLIPIPVSSIPWRDSSDWALFFSHMHNTYEQVYTEISLYLSQLQLPIQYRHENLKQHLFKCTYFRSCSCSCCCWCCCRFRLEFCLFFGVISVFVFNIFSFLLFFFALRSIRCALFLLNQAPRFLLLLHLSVCYVPCVCVCVCDSKRVRDR